MRGKFVVAAEAERDELDWGSMTWISRPQTTGAKDLVAIEVNLECRGRARFSQAPGSGRGYLRYRGEHRTVAGK